MMLVVSIPPAKAQFVLASWDYPDEYGQGIETIYLYQNISGDFVAFTGSPFSSSSNTVYTIEVTGNLWIKTVCWFNRTQAGIPNILSQGLNLIRHNIIVTQFNGTVVFSQENFTKTASSQAGDPLWWLQYEVVLDFIPEYGEVYTAIITYEVFY